MSQRYRNICFTYNSSIVGEFNPDDPEHHAELSFFPDINVESANHCFWPPFCTYMVWQWEKGLESGVWHAQGYMEFSKQIRWVEYKKLPFWDTAHIEARMGTQEEAIAYVTKPETRLFGPFTQGILKKQGTRKDCEQVLDLVKSNASLLEITESHPGYVMRYGSGISRIRALYSNTAYVPAAGTAPPPAKRLVFLLGTSGVGKSYRALHSIGLPGQSVYFKPHGKWWDGYDGQDIIIFDDWYGGSYQYTHLLTLLDRYEATVEVKGGTANITSKLLIFTSNEHPMDWYKNLDTHQTVWNPDVNPLCRRVKDFGEIFVCHSRDYIERIAWNVPWKMPRVEQGNNNNAIPEVLLPPVVANPPLAYARAPSLIVDDPRDVITPTQIIVRATPPEWEDDVIDLEALEPAPKVRRESKNEASDAFPFSVDYGDFDFSDISELSDF